MSETKWIPAPWFPSLCLGGAYEIRHGIRAHPKGTVVKEMYGKYNVALVSVAPDMFDLLYEAFQLVGSEYDDELEWKREAMDVMARAKGEDL